MNLSGAKVSVSPSAFVISELSVFLGRKPLSRIQACTWLLKAYFAMCYISSFHICGKIIVLSSEAAGTTPRHTSKEQHC